MKMNRIHLLILLLLFLNHCCAQEVYSFWKDDAQVKERNYQLSLDKKKQWMAGVGKKDAATYQQLYDKHFTEVADIWQSSRSVTAAHAQQYLETLFSRIKKSNPALANSDARILFTRDWWPNAYSLGEGTIVINAGLMLHLQNEAQLAFVLCHELAHYHLDHSLKSIKRYVDTMNSAAVQQELKRLSKDKYRVNQQLEQLAKSLAFNSRRHSRDYEAEADNYALQLLKQTDFDVKQALTALALLDKIDDIETTEKLNLQTTLNPPGYPFRQQWIKAETSIFSQMKTGSEMNQKEKDSLKTHPDCQHRIALLQPEINGSNARQLFFTDEQHFAQLKKELYAEMMERCYDSNNLSRYLYLALLMLQREGFQPVAVQAVAKGLNTVYQRQQSHKLGLAVDTENRAYPEDYNLLLRMLNRVRLEELAALNEHFCNQYLPQMKEYPAFKKEQAKAKQLNNTP